MTNRSARSTRWGETYRPACTPAATSAAWTIAVVEPLPFVPATWSVVNARSGCPSAAHSREILSSPSLTPNVSSAKRRSSNSARRLRVDRACHRDGGRDGWRGLCPHESERPPEDGLHLAAIHDQIEHAVLDEKFTALEPRGQLLPDRLLDDARPRETDQGFRLFRCSSPRASRSLP